MKNMLIRQGTVPAHSLYAAAECLQIKDVNPSGLSTEYCGVESWLPGMCKYAEPVSPEKELYFYHPDHLGSSSWITGSDGQPTQYLAYLPFGEEFIDQQTSNWSAAYKFTGKEKDVETGYNYFGARYYLSDLGIWASVDPLSDKYPHQTPYSYVGNRPINVVDPNGMYEWDLNKKGYLTKRENGRTDIDIVHGVNKDGKQVSRNFKANSICNNSKEYSGILDDGTPDGFSYTTNYMEFSDGETATDFFEFAAEYSDVEWALKISNDKSHVGTSHNEGFVAMPSPKGMIVDVHSHLSGDRYKIGGSDHYAAYTSAQDGIIFKVYLQGSGTYATYNASTGALSDRKLTKTASDKIKQMKMISNLKW